MFARMRYARPENVTGKPSNILSPQKLKLTGLLGLSAWVSLWPIECLGGVEMVRVAGPKYKVGEEGPVGIPVLAFVQHSFCLLRTLQAKSPLCKSLQTESGEGRFTQGVTVGKWVSTGTAEAEAKDQNVPICALLSQVQSMTSLMGQTGEASPAAIDHRVTC